MSRDDWREMTDYLLGCDPSEPDIFKDPTTMTREQFEAHVRAEATKKHVLTADLSGIEYAKMMGRREAYIAARMEHEWKLVELLWRFVDITKPNNGAWCDTFDRFPVHLKLDAAEYDRLHDAHIDATAALSPYTTKPIEP